MKNSSDSDYNHINRKIVVLSLLIFVVMTMVVGYSYFWNIQNIKEGKLELALQEAQANWNKDAAFRRWATGHGGIYVTPDERTPPNPALAHIPDRDVVTTSGKKLTLMNPAYMMRQMTEEFEADYGIKGKITGKRQLNPINRPDSWELQALNLFESEQHDQVVEQTDINGEPYLRYMKPMYMTAGCVKCHAVLGYKDGDLRGGVSIAIPLTPYFAAAEESNRGIFTTHAIVWLIGSLAIIAFTKIFSSLLVRITHDALHDGLTKLPNLSLFRDRINQAIQKHYRNPLPRILFGFLFFAKY